MKARTVAYVDHVSISSFEFGSFAVCADRSAIVLSSLNALDWGAMHYLLYIAGAYMVVDAIMLYPSIKSAIHQILFATEIGFGFVVLGLGAIVSRLWR